MYRIYSNSIEERVFDFHLCGRYGQRQRNFFVSEKKLCARCFCVQSMCFIVLKRCSMFLHWNKFNFRVVLNCFYAMALFWKLFFLKLKMNFFRFRKMIAASCACRTYFKVIATKLAQFFKCERWIALFFSESLCIFIWKEEFFLVALVIFSVEIATRYEFWAIKLCTRWNIRWDMNLIRVYLLYSMNSLN